MKIVMFEMFDACLRVFFKKVPPVSSSWRGEISKKGTILLAVVLVWIRFI